MRPGFTTATHSSGFPLPLPIRVSAGFLVTGLSGKIRIQILPPRLRLRESATRAASICRFVTQPGSSAFSPYAPHAGVAVPLLARDLAAAQPPRACDPDAVGAEPQRGGDRLLHGAAECDALLE